VQLCTLLGFTGEVLTMTPDYFRKQAEALYVLAGATKDATERLAYILKAMECEARAVDAERGKLPLAYVAVPKAGGGRESA
jgi:hypothetical protein